ncbi:MAG: SDR family NAD(P)-dependent oxidoreductase [Burkholderiales bacterium]
MSVARELEGRVALVTGGARNIGRKLAEDFAQAGAAVVVNTRASQKEAEAAAAELRAKGCKAMAAIADVSDREAVYAMVEQIVKEFGRLDIVINNAVSHGYASFEEMSFETWQRTVAVTLHGAFHCTQASIPHLVKAGGGSIVNMGGMFGHKPHVGRAATSAAKAGLAGLTRALALELAPRNINVNYVSPGPVNTVREVPARVDLSTIPLGRFAEIGEVTAVVKLLCSPQGRYITGQTIHVNGGSYMNA